MNKKIQLAVIPAVALGCMTAAINTNLVSNISTPTVMAASKQNFSKQNYALMAFLQWSNQDLKDIQDQSITLTAGKNNTFTTQSNGQKVTITVGHTKVTVKDGNGNKKTFTKAKLEKAFKNQNDDLNAKVASNSESENNAGNNNGNTTGNTTSQSGSQSTQDGNSNQAASDDDDDSDDGSYDGYTFEERTHLDPNDPDFIPATHDNFEGFN